MTTYHTLNGKDLPDYCNIDIEKEDDSWVVYFNSRFHIDKRVRMPVSYSGEYAHKDILKDPYLYSEICRRYGAVTACPLCGK